MILTGPPASDPGGFTLDHVAATLSTGFASPEWAPKFGRGGVGVTSDPLQSAKWVSGRTQKPFCFLEVASIERDTEYNEGPHVFRWLVEISIEAVVLPDASQFEEALKAAVLSILTHALSAFSALGIEEAEARQGQGQSPNPERINPFTLSAAIHVAHVPLET